MKWWHNTSIVKKEKGKETQFAFIIPQVLPIPPSICFYSRYRTWSHSSLEIHVWAPFSWVLTR